MIKRFLINSLLLKIHLIVIAGFVFSGCTNPFAPKLDENLAGAESLISEQTTIDGIFKNMQYAYTFKDTTLYGGLLAPDFTFTFRDYDKEVDVAWGREDEMFVTYSLFSNTERLDLVWNNIVTLTNDSTNVVRSFNLTVTFNTTNVEYVDGKVNLQLRKNEANGKWQIVSWIDESNF